MGNRRESLKFNLHICLLPIMEETHIFVRPILLQYSIKLHNAFYVKLTPLTSKIKIHIIFYVGETLFMYGTK